MTPKTITATAEKGSIAKSGSRAEIGIPKLQQRRRTVSSAGYGGNGGPLGLIPEHARELPEVRAHGAEALFQELPLRVGGAGGAPQGLRMLAAVQRFFAGHRHSEYRRTSYSSPEGIFISGKFPIDTREGRAGEKVWAVQGSNLRPPPCKGGALPLS